MPAMSQSADELVGIAQGLALFKSGANPGVKPRVVWLLELASVGEWRQAAVQAIHRLGVQRKRAPYRVTEAISKCAAFVPSVEWLDVGSLKGAPPVSESEREWQRNIVVAQKSKPYEFTPMVTEAVIPDRHPWDGYVDPMTFTEVSAGIGMFAAAFEAAGMVCTKLVEPNERALQLAVKNCSVGSEQPSGLADVDPADMLWTHGLVGGPECQPYSSAGRQRAWADPRSYTLLRTLHLMAVMKPWWVWLENVSAIQTALEGGVWEVVQEIAAMSGYEVKITQV